MRNKDPGVNKLLPFGRTPQSFGLLAKARIISGLLPFGRTPQSFGLLAKARIISGLLPFGRTPKTLESFQTKNSAKLVDLPYNPCLKIP